MKRLDFINLLALTPLIKLMNLNELGKICFLAESHCPALCVGWTRRKVLM